MSYTTSPISEYLGSHIYKMLGFKTHNTLLGIANDKVVVACQDFLKQNETILDYNSLKNDYNEQIEQKIEELSSSNKKNYGTDIDEIIFVMNNNSYFQKVPNLKKQFWNMFIIDAFINNNDRNDNNWGLILNHDTMDLRICPIFDNGASFYSKSSDERIETLLKDNFKTKQILYDNTISFFTQNNKIINPLKFIESMSNSDCNNALIHIFPKKS